MPDAPSPAPGARPAAPPPALAAPALPDLGRSLLAVRVSLVALIVLCLAWELWLAPTGRGTLAVKVLPLLIALPGAWRGRTYTLRWLSLAVWLYVTEGLVRATSEGGPGQWLAVGETLLGVAVFVAAAWHVRRWLKHHHAQAAATGQPSP
jgi:uncharacterized membrane protein